jgi:hypothetical protein
MAAAEGIAALKRHGLAVRPLQEAHAGDPVRAAS